VPATKEGVSGRSWPSVVATETQNPGTIGAHFPLEEFADLGRPWWQWHGRENPKPQYKKNKIMCHTPKEGCRRRVEVRNIGGTHRLPPPPHYTVQRFIYQGRQGDRMCPHRRTAFISFAAGPPNGMNAVLRAHTQRRACAPQGQPWGFVGTAGSRSRAGRRKERAGQNGPPGRGEG
jgi:hypothetical protein